MEEDGGSDRIMFKEEFPLDGSVEHIHMVPQVQPNTAEPEQNHVPVNETKDSEDNDRD